MIKPLAYLVLLTLIFFNCTTPKGYYPLNGILPDVDCSVNCQQVIERIKDKWLRSTEEGCYFIDDKSIQLLEENDTCFKGWKVSDVIGFFGEPENMVKVMSYRISKECSGSYYNTSHIIYFIYEDADVDLADRVISYHSVSRNYPSH